MKNWKEIFIRIMPGKNQPMNRKNLMRLLGPVIFILIVCNYLNFDKLQFVIRNLQWFYFGLSLAVVPLLILIRAMRWKMILSKLGINYPLWECYKIYFVEMVAIMVVATIGTFVKVLYLRRDGYGLSKPLLSAIADKFYDYLLPVYFGIVSILVVYYNITPKLSLSLFLGGLSLLFIPLRKSISLFSSRFIPNRLQAVLSKKGWDINKDLKQLYVTLEVNNYILSVAGFITYFLIIYFLSEGIQLDFSLIQVVLILSITSIVTMLPISFLGIGTRDVGLIAAFHFFGRRPEEAVIFSLALLLLRLVILLMGSIFWFINPPPLSKGKHVQDYTQGY